MKRLIAAILLLCMCVGFYGCSDVPEEQISTTQPTEEQETTTPSDTVPTEETTQAMEDTIIALEMGVPVTAGIWQYTLMDIQFARDIGNYDEYENYLVPGGKKSSTNPFRLEDDEIFGVVTYKLKMIGKEKQNLSSTLGTGRFIYGDGFVFDTSTDGKRASASCYDGARFSSMTGFDVLEPLSDEIECRVAFALPIKVTENEIEPLVYEVSFNELGDNKTFSYTIR